jgi:hypothetical protein
MKKSNTKPQAPPKITLLEKADQYFSGKDRLSFFAGLTSTILFALLLFEPKVSIGGDDSMYINRAYNFIHNGTFPAFQGPLYPIVLSAIMAFSGINLVAFKIFSFLCIIGHYWFSYKLFKKYLPPFLLFVFLILIGCSASILSFASTTYSEGFYMFLQSVFLFLFDKYYFKDPSPDQKKNFFNFLLISSILVLIFLARNVGLVALISVVGFLILEKKVKAALSFLAIFVVFYGIYHILKTSIWDIPEVQAAGQGSSLLLKNSFKPGQGNETVFGFLLRLVGNSASYLGFHLFNIFGISSTNKFTGNAIIAFIVYLIFFRGLYASSKRSRFWFFIGIYILVTIGVTFFVLQTYWNQERLIVVVAPLILIYLLNTLYDHFTSGLKRHDWIFVMFISILIVANVISTTKKIPKQVAIISNYLKGDNLYGYPEDWQNYLNMVKWVSKNLPEDSYVACRKPGMAFIYSKGKNFYGIWRVPGRDPDELYNQLKDAGVTHVIMASLRTNPELEESPLINTVRIYLETINKAYPGKLKLIHKTGEKWPVYLYELY